MEFMILSAILCVACGVLAIMAFRKPPADAGLARQIQALNESSLILQNMISQQFSEQSQAINKRLEESTGVTHKNLSDLRERLAVIDAAQKNIMGLSETMVSLQDILASKNKRGIFGEVQLQDIISTILPASLYEFQASLSNGKRADCLLKLPNPPGAMVVDAKFPLENYEAFAKTDHPEARQQAARKLVQDMNRHISDIAEKYIVPGETGEGAMLFLPSESIFSDLHAHFPEIIQKSHKARVWIVSPNTLMAVMHTIRGIVRDVKIRDQAREIQHEMLKLLQDIEKLDGHVASLDRHFHQALQDVNQLKSTRDKIGNRAQKITEIDTDETAGTLPPAVAEIKKLTSVS